MITKPQQTEARYAFSVCLYYSIVFGASFVGGMFGGPVGAALGATLGTGIGLAAETGITELIVDDPTMRDELTTLTIWRFLKEEDVNTVSAFAGEAASEEIGEDAIKLLASQN